MRRSQIGKFFDDGSTEPIGVLHHRFNRPDQFQFAMTPLMNVLDDPQDAGVPPQRDGGGRDETFRQAAFLRAHRCILAAKGRPFVQLFRSCVQEGRVLP